MNENSPDDLAALEAELAEAERTVVRRVDPGSTALPVAVAVLGVLIALMLPWTGDVAGWEILAGVANFIVTDIAKDGKLQGPNLDMLKHAHFALQSGVIASGGISTLEDVREVTALGVDGAIIGRALYDGRVDLAEAIAAGRVR